MKNTHPYQELEASMFAALETYSNVHRGSGHFSKTTTHLYEKSREIVLDFLGLNRAKYRVLFLTPRRAEAFTKSLKPGSYVTLHSREFGLSLGVTALAVRKNALPKGVPFETGGGTTKLYGKDWVMWANAPDRFEAGTPAIINIIAFAKALLLIKKYGKDAFREESIETAEARQVLHDDDLGAYQGIELLQELRKTRTGRNIQVPTTKGLQHFISFDNSASTPAFMPVWNAFLRTYRRPANFRNEIIVEVKRICAEIMGAPSADYEVFFTSNTTESINMAAQSLAGSHNNGTVPINNKATSNGNAPENDNASKKSNASHKDNVSHNENASHNENSSHTNIEPVILTTILEHSSNDLPWRQVNGHSLIRLAVGNDGFFNLDELEALMKSYNKENQHGMKRITLLTVSGASNVLGSCNDLSAIGPLAKKYGARLFVDAAQLAAHRKIDMQAAGIDYMAFSAHKVYAPFGTGVLIARKGLLHSNNDETALHNASALENAGGIAALGKALLILNRIGFDLIEEEEKRLTNKALQAMSKIPGLKLHGVVPDNANSSMNRIGVITFEIGNKMPARIAASLVRYGGIGVRFGCHCAHLIIKQLGGFTTFGEKFQRFFLKMVPMLNLQGIVRASLGIQNTDADVEVLIRELKRIAGPAATVASHKDGSITEKGAIVVSDKLVKQQIKEFIKTRESLVFG